MPSLSKILISTDIDDIDKKSIENAKVQKWKAAPNPDPLIND